MIDDGKSCVNCLLLLCIFVALCVCSLYVFRLNRKFYCTSDNGNVTLGRSSVLMVFSLKCISRSSMMILWPRKKTRKSYE